jgi:hypothetical protein
MLLNRALETHPQRRLLNALPSAHRFQATARDPQRLPRVSSLRQTVMVADAVPGGDKQKLPPLPTRNPR